MPDCYFCNRVGAGQRKIIVDMEHDPSDKGDNMVGIWESVWLCQEHLNDYDNREGEFEPGRRE